MSEEICFPTKGGICLTCDDYDNCPMNDMLSNHRKNVKDFGENYKDIRPDLWDEESIEEPEIEDGNVEWCPMYFSDKTTKSNENR